MHPCVCAACCCCCCAAQIDSNRRVVEFAEKPKGDALKAMQVDTTVLGLNKEEAKKKPYIASMGIYVFKKGVLGRKQLANVSCQARSRLAKGVLAIPTLWYTHNLRQTMCS